MKNLTQGFFVHIAGEHREEGGGGFFVLVHINDNECWNFCSVERADDKNIQL